MKFEFEDIDEFHQRAKVPGGWLVKSVDPIFHRFDGEMVNGYDWRTAMCFVPDQKHEWVIDKGA